jgi:hypothetical protein
MQKQLVQAWVCTPLSLIVTGRQGVTSLGAYLQAACPWCGLGACQLVSDMCSRESHICSRDLQRSPLQRELQGCCQVASLLK